MASQISDEKSNVNGHESYHENEPELELAHKATTNVEGTTQLYTNGQLRCIPMPTADPRDPLNMPRWRKFMAIFTLCYIGSISISAQQIFASLLPILVKEYANPELAAAAAASTAAATVGGVGGTGGSPVETGAPASGSNLNGASNSNPSFISITMTPTSSAAPQSTKVNPNALASLAEIPGAPPLWKVNLLSSLPILIVGLSNYVLVPLSIIFGRRPIILICATLSWTMLIWAGMSKTLNEHLAARCMQALGSGAVESLIPYIVQDMSFIHQRNRAIGIVWASQGIVTLALGIGSTHIVSNLSWRWLYFIMSIICGIAWAMVILFVPETRWKRTPAEMRGDSGHLAPGLSRPEIDYERFPRRTWKTNLAIYKGPVNWADGRTALYEIVRSLFFPNVFMIILVNAAFIGISLSSSQVMTPVLLAPPYSWPFSSIGYSVIPIFLASGFVWAFGGVGADKLANYMTKRRGGVREAEVHLLNFAFPLFIGILGSILFGIGGTYSQNVSWATILIGLAMLNFAFLTINIIGSVYCVECYPNWAGPVLVNAASFRNIIGFAFSYGVTDWVVARGYMGCFGIFAGVIAFVSCGVIALYVFGKRLRIRTNRLVKSANHHTDD